jgi:asparagine synthase (glutamine-hydrolysing)
MCGIAGSYNFGCSKKIDEGLIKKMCSVLVHRGPDDEGVYCNGNIGLGHRRLSIIDIEGGHQPMSNEDGSVWIVFNGEIYNFHEIEADLIKKGHIFKTRCDTEAIIHLYEDEREECLAKLSGMFAFAIWDNNRKELFLARDRVGIKPLHYSILSGKIVFASEIKAILQDPDVRRQVDREALDDYLSLSYVPAPKTMFKGIKKLPAGNYLVCKKDGIKVKEYWDIDFSNTSSDNEFTIQGNIYSKLKESVGSQLISDVTLGAFLSGGIDSSAIVSLMSEIQNKSVITNSIGFSEKSHDELGYARIVAKKYSTAHHEYIVEPKALDVLEKLTWFYDEPFGDSSSIPTYYVSKMARQNVKVALSGDGGDEDFAGYTKYMYSNAAVRVQNMLPRSIKTVVRTISSNIPDESGNLWLTKLKNKLGDLYLSPFEMYFKIISIFKEYEKAILYSDELKKELKDYSGKAILKNIFDKCNSCDYVSRLQYLDIKTSLSEDMLAKVDRASMANSLEVRVPLLDHTFMEYVATIPSRFKISGLSGKDIFKKAMSKNLPPEIMGRSKMGFSVPIETWLQNELRGMVEEELFAENGSINEFFNIDYIKRTWALALHGRIKCFDTSDFAHRIWLLFIFSRWHKMFIGN